MRTLVSGPISETDISELLTHKKDRNTYLGWLGAAY